VSISARVGVTARVQRWALHASGQWEAAIDPTSGKTYYWNTETRATSWENPIASQPFADSGSGGLTAASSELKRATEVSGSSGGRATAAGDIATPSGAQAAAANSSGDGNGQFAQSLATLLLALQSDPTGMEFGSKARELRPLGVFSEQFFDYLGSQIDAKTGEDRVVLERLMARLSNPLLRQAAPFE